jgi:hypothetical protein
MLVILSSVALVLGSTLWRKVYRLFGVRGMLLGSALLSTAAALLCVVAESCGQWFHLWAYGTTFFLATVAAQAVFAASISWIGALAAEQYRGTLIGFGANVGCSRIRRAGSRARPNRPEPHNDLAGGHRAGAGPNCRDRGSGRTGSSRGRCAPGERRGRGFAHPTRSYQTPSLATGAARAQPHLRRRAATPAPSSSGCRRSRSAGYR